MKRRRVVWRQAEYLRGRERLALYRTLHGQDAELISAVLRTVPVFGDARALPFLLHLAQRNGLAATDETIRAEAQTSLSRLRVMIDLNSGSGGLLRASSIPQAPEEQLLHPLQGKPTTDPKELLRAGIRK